MSQKIKKGLLFLKELRGTYDGLSLTSPRLVEEIIFHGVKDAIICLDDFERLSKSLDIKDVMGLINFLKVENNCQIVLIMHDDQLKDDNYKGYKEKVFDEQLTIPSVLPLLQGMTYKNDRHKEVFIKFYECLGVNNFRFYKKVERLYRRFEKYLPEPHSEFIDSLVLERIFEGVLITDIPKFFYTWDAKKKLLEQFIAVQFNRDNNEESLTPEQEKSKKTHENLQDFSKNIEFFDDWDEVFSVWFTKGIIDSPKLEKLIKNELSAIEKQDATETVSALQQKRFRDLNVDGSFSTNFHEQALRNINYTSLTNLDFYCQILEMFDRKDLALILENKIQQSIIEGYNSNPLRYKNQLKDDMFYKPGRFDDFIKDFESKNINLFKTSLLTAVDRIVNKEIKNLNDIEAIENSNKDDWRALILHDFATLEDRCTVHEMISRMSRHESEQLENGKLKQWIIEILEEKYPDGTEFEGYRKFLISQLDTLGK